MQRKLRGLSILIATAAVAGCSAYVPMADKDVNKSAKSFVPKAGLANIYVYRSDKLGAAVKMQVALDGVVAGDTVKKTFIVKQVHPGRHTVVSKAENVATLDVFAVAGRNYFVWQDVQFGVMRARAELQLVDEAEGREGVRKCKLIE